jgi:hypothetical protein
MADSSDSVFQTKNGERDTSATMQRILNEMSNGTDPSAPPMPPPAQAGEPGQPSKPDAPAGTAKAGVNAPQHLSDLDTADKMSAFWGSFGPKVAKDVAYGATLEAPGQIVGGAFDFYRHAGQAVGEFGDFLNKHLPASMVGTPEEQALEAQNRAKIRELAGKGEFSSENVLGIGGAPTTTTGGIVRSISEFMAGYSQPLALLKAGKIPEFLASPGAAGISMFLGTDPNQPNLTSMIVKQYPGLQGPISDVLATGAGDNAALNRLRHAAEGFAGTVAAELIVRGITAVGRFTKATEVQPGAAAQPGVPPAAAPADAQTQQAQSLVDAVAGKPQAGVPPVSVEVGPPTGAGAGMAGEGPSAMGVTGKGPVSETPPVAGAGEAAAPPAGAPSSTGVPIKTSLTEQPPGVQAPLTKLSTLPDPSASSISRRGMPSTSTGPATTVKFDELSLGTRNTSNAIIRQGTTDSNALLAAGEKVKPELEQALADVASNTPGVEVATSDVAPNGVRVKTAQGVADKIDTGRSPEAISDYVAGRLSVDSPQAAADALNDLGNRFKVLEVDDKITKPVDGYRAIHVQVEVAPGLSAEIQIVPKEINKVQELFHSEYDAYKRIVNPTPEQEAAIKVSKAKVAQGMDEAWSKQAWDVPTAQVGVPGQVTGKAVTEATLAQKLTDIRTKVNWDNIEKGNLDGVIGQIAGEMKGKISDAKRGQITLATQKQMADALGLLPEDLIARQSGQALNAEQIIAAGQLMQASDERLLQLAIEAQKPTASAVDAMKVNEALITHMALIEQFLGASGEAGRALGALRVVHQQGPLSRARGLQVLLQEHGGEEGMKRLSQMITDLNAAGKPPGAINAALSRGWYRWSKDAIQEATAMGYLWRPTTQVRNIVGNVAMAIQQGIDRSAAEKFATVLGQEATVAPGEAMAYVRGQLSSLGEAFRTAGKAFTTGERQFEPLLTGTPIEQAQARGVSAASVAQQRRLSAAATQAFTDSPFGKVIDFVGGVQRLPGRFLQAEDDFFKVIGYAGEIEAQAHRAAMAQGLAGKDYADAVATMISNPPENVKLAAVDHALYATFNNNPGKFASDIMRARNNFLPMYMMIPYVRTPTNLFRVAMEHSPIAPALEQWRADIASGGAAQSLALAKMATGSAAMALLYDFAHNGHLTGPMRGEKAYSEAQRGMGIRPMSVRIGKLNVEISGLGQLAPMIAFAGAVNELMANKDIHPEGYDSIDEWSGAVGSILAYSTADQSYLQGLGKVFGAISDSAKTGAGGAMGAYIRDLASSQMNLIPGVGLARSVGSAMDPQQRQIATFMDALLYKDIPGLSDKLIPMRDVFGHEIAQQPAGRGGQLYNYISPFRLSWQNDHPAFNEMVRLHTGLERIAWKAAFQNVNVNFRDHPEVLDYYRRLAGNELQYNPKTGEKIGFEDFINRVVSGKDPIYSQIYKTRSDPGETGVDSGKSLFIKEWAQAYRQAAQKQIMSEAKTRFPDFYDEIKKGQAHRETQKLPTYLQGQGIEQGQQAVSTAMERPVQDPLPDRFGKPSVVPRRNPTAGGGFAVPSQ